jgi:hypothetical protein
MAIVGSGAAVGAAAPAARVGSAGWVGWLHAPSVSARAVAAKPILTIEYFNGVLLSNVTFLSYQVWG